MSLAFSCATRLSSSCFICRATSFAGASCLSNRSASLLASAATRSSCLEIAISPNAFPYGYRDAVEFRNGLNVRLQDLDEGHRVAVLALSSEETDVALGLMTDRFGQARP